VGDRGFCSFLHLAMLAARGPTRSSACTTARSSTSRRTGRTSAATPRPRRGPRASRGRDGCSVSARDQVVEWSKPGKRPPWLVEESFAALPTTLVLRELRYDVGRPGYRTRSVTLVTTLLDAEAYPPEALAELYGMRWRVDNTQTDYPSRGWLSPAA
jgi:hypothetical protein